jgi:hypothetical protein
MSIKTNWDDFIAGLAQDWAVDETTYTQTYAADGTDPAKLMVMENSDKNVAYAVFGRHFGTGLKWTAKTLEKFADWWKKDCAIRWTKPVHLEQSSFEEFLAQSEPKKAKAYAQAMDTLVNTGYKPKEVATFFMKRHEKSLGETRPRNICNLDVCITVMTAPVARQLTKIMKQLYPACIGENYDGLADIIEKAWAGMTPEEYVDIATDGGSWDSHQSLACRNLVDNAFIDRWFVEAFNASGLHPCFYTDSLRLLKKTSWKFECKYPGSRANLATGTIIGTTMSGHSTQTTLGNTLRQWAVHAFCARDLDSVTLVSGDDTVTRIRKTHKQKFLHRYFKVHSLEKKGDHGLGLQTSGYQENSRPTPFRSIGFLSKTITVIPGMSRLARPPWRLVRSNFTDTQTIEKAEARAAKVAQGRKIRQHGNRKQIARRQLVGIDEAAAAVTTGMMHDMSDPLNKGYVEERVKITGVTSTEKVNHVKSHYEVNHNTHERDFGCVEPQLFAMAVQEWGQQMIDIAPHSEYSAEAFAAEARLAINQPTLTA